MGYVSDYEKGKVYGRELAELCRACNDLADDECGLGPVEDADESLARIAIELSKRRQRIAQLEATLRHVPIARHEIADFVGFTCIGCGSRSGMRPGSGEAYDEPCKDGCWVQHVERTLSDTRYIELELDRGLAIGVLKRRIDVLIAVLRACLDGMRDEGVTAKVARSEAPSIFREGDGKALYVDEAARRALEEPRYGT